MKPGDDDISLQAELGLRLVGLAIRASSMGKPYLVCPTLRSSPIIYVVGGALEEIIDLASGREPCSRWVPKTLREDLLEAAQSCLERQGGEAVLIPLGLPGGQLYVAAGPMDQIGSLAASQITNLRGT